MRYYPTLTIAKIMKAARCSSSAAVRALRENPSPQLQPGVDRYRLFKSGYGTRPGRRK